MGDRNITTSIVVDPMIDKTPLVTCKDVRIVTLDSVSFNPASFSIDIIKNFGLVISVYPK